MRVLFLSHATELGGAEVMLELMATGLTRLGVKIEVALGGIGPLADRLRAAGIPTQVLPIGTLAAGRRRHVPASPKLAVDLVRTTATLRRLMIGMGTDVLVTNSQKAHLVGSVAARAAGVPVAWRLHDVVCPGVFGEGQILALRAAALAGRPRVLSVSNAVDVAARQALRFRNTAVIHNGVDVARLRPQRPLDLRAHFGWPSASVVFGTVGRLVRWKGGLELLAAAALVAPRAESVRFVLVGDELIDAETGFRNQLIAMTRSLGIADRVGLLPFTDDVGAVLDQIDVLVQPSIEPDPFPTAVLEAAVTGTPVIAFDHGGISEMVVGGEHGLLVAPGDVKGLADACVALAVDARERSRMGEAIRSVGERFTAERMCQELLSELVAMVERQRLGR